MPYGTKIGAENFSFNVMGDIQIEWAEPTWTTCANWMLAKDPDFWIAVGDIVSYGGSQSNWDGVYTAGRNLFNNKVFCPLIGNHEMYNPGSHNESWPQRYIDQYNLPDNGSGTLDNDSSTQDLWYSFEYGDALFLFLHWENLAVFPGAYQKQNDWLANELNNSTKKWKFAFYHQPSYSSFLSTMAFIDNHPVWDSLFESKGVAAAISGDAHKWESMIPIKNKVRTNSFTGATCYYVCDNLLNDGNYPDSLWFTRKRNVNPDEEKLNLIIDITADSVVLNTYNYLADTLWDQIIIYADGFDTWTPQAPANLQASSQTGYSVDLVWDKVADSCKITGYYIYQDDVPVNTIYHTDTFYSIRGLTPSTAYSFTVTTMDESNNESALSNVLNITTSPPDTEDPSVPSNIVSTNISPFEISISWDESIDNYAVVGYNVFKDGVKQNSQLLSSTSYSYCLLEPETSYSFTVSAIDIAGNESAQSTASDINTSTLPAIQEYRYLKVIIEETQGLQISEIEWFEGADNHPSPFLTSSTWMGKLTSNGQGDYYLLFDGDVNLANKHIVNNGPEYYVLDLGVGNEIIPTDVTIHIQSWCTIEKFSCWGSNDNTNWDLLLVSNHIDGSVAKTFTIRTVNHLAVTNGIYDTGNGFFPETKVINIAADPAPGGMEFDYWSGDAQYITDINSANTTLTMPSEDITVIANYRSNSASTYTLTVNNGSGDGDYTESAIVNINADAPQTGQEFSSWTGDIDSITNINNPSTTISMPANNTTITANYVDVIYTLSVIDGTGSGNYNYNTVIDIIADPASAGMIFNAWIGDVANIAEIYDSTTTITMPAQNSNITATYRSKSIPTYTLDITNGSGNGEYVENTVVNITADAAPFGQEFYAWTGDIANISNGNDSSTTINMPAENISIVATFKDLPTYILTVNNGTGSGNYLEGEIVNIFANTAPTGQEFNMWMGQTANLDDASSTSTFIVMPAENVSIGVNYSEVLENSLDRKEDFAFYPNPASDVVYFRNNKELKSIRIYNNTGQIMIVDTEISSKSSVEISHFEKGLYIIVIINYEGGTYHYNLIKM